MNNSWKAFFMILLFSCKVQSATSVKVIGLSIDSQKSNDINLVVQISAPEDEKVFGVRYILESLGDPGFKDHLKPAKIISPKGSASYFIISRQYLHTGNYVIKAEVDYKVGGLLGKILFFKNEKIKKVELEFEIEKTLGDADS